MGRCCCVFFLWFLSCLEFTEICEYANLLLLLSTKFGNSLIIFSNIFSASITLFLYFGTPVICIFDPLILYRSPDAYVTCFYFPFLVLFSWGIFKFTDSCLCYHQYAFDPMQWHLVLDMYFKFLHFYNFSSFYFLTEITCFSINFKCVFLYFMGYSYNSHFICGYSDVGICWLFFPLELITFFLFSVCLAVCALDIVNVTGSKSLLYCTGDCWYFWFCFSTQSTQLG